MAYTLPYLPFPNKAYMKCPPNTKVKLFLNNIIDFFIYIIDRKCHLVI
jgi:hypothetical protein